jgi:aspyridone synthetase trans-acting enoyl reductase
MDCVTNSETMKMCYEAIGSSGGSYISLEPTTTQVKYTRRDIRADWLMAHSILGVSLKLRGAFGRPSTPDHRNFGAHWFPLVERMLQEGQLKNHPLEIREGGLANMSNIVEDFRSGTVRARKLVVPLRA